jgi:hypothetical protein
MTTTKHSLPVEDFNDFYIWCEASCATYSNPLATCNCGVDRLKKEIISLISKAREEGREEERGQWEHKIKTGELIKKEWLNPKWLLPHELLSKEQSIEEEND